MLQPHELKQFLLFPVVFATLALTFFVLIVWQQLLLPLIMAIVIWYLIVTLATAASRIPVLGRHLPPFFCYLLAFAFCIGTGWVVLDIITANVSTLMQKLPTYQERLVGQFHSWLGYLGVANPPDIMEILGRFDVVSVVTATATLTRDIARNAGIILIYVMFLLWEHRSFNNKLAALIADKERLRSAQSLIQEIASQIQAYIRIKVLTSLLAAGASYMVLRLVGVDFAEFWAMLIFLLNFIPYIGSVIAAALPSILALVQFDTMSPFIIVTASLIVIQFVVDNVMVPKMTGNAFNLSALAIILSLTIWGQVWGVVGMFLCVPITVMASLILAKFEVTRPIAILLSKNGYPKSRV